MKYDLLTPGSQHLDELTVVLISIPYGETRVI